MLIRLKRVFLYLPVSGMEVDSVVRTPTVVVEAAWVEHEIMKVKTS